MTGFEFLPFPGSWGETEKALYVDAFEPVGALEDSIAQTYYNLGYFDMGISKADRINMRQKLDEYMISEYGVQFSAIFDWDAWREAYPEL